MESSYLPCGDGAEPRTSATEVEAAAVEAAVVEAAVVATAPKVVRCSEKSTRLSWAANVGHERRRKVTFSGRGPVDADVFFRCTKSSSRPQ